MGQSAFTKGSIATPVSIANGGTNATTASQALANLGGLPLAGGTLVGALIALDVTISNGYNLKYNGNNVLIAPLVSGSAGTAGQVLTSAGSTSNPTWSSTPTINPNVSQVTLSTTLGANLTYTGTIETGTVGEAVVFGDVLYLKFSDGKWWKAKADSYTTTPAARMALASISANASGTLLIEGNVRYDSWALAANKVYLSAATAGALTTTQPATTGNQIQVLGVAKTSTTMYFKPSLDVGEK